MRKTLVVCDGCQQEHSANTLALLSWLQVEQCGKEYHFCSVGCMAKHFHISQQEPQSNPDCKARRFLLWDEQGNSTEGVKWGDGRVQLEVHKWEGESIAKASFPDWDEFKASFPGSGVQWIDQEVAE